MTDDGAGADGDVSTEDSGGVEDGGCKAEDADGEAVRSPLAALERVRTDARTRAVALAAAAVVGIALAWLHWLGLVLAGALVGLVSRDLPRALLAGLAAGALVLAVFALALGSAAPRAFAMTPASYVTVASALGLPVLGALVRGLV